MTLDPLRQRRPVRLANGDLDAIAQELVDLRFARA